MPRKFYLANNKLLSHVVFWAVWIFLNTIFLGSYEGTFLRQFYVELYELPEKLVVVYFNLYVLIPVFLLKKKYLAYSVSVTGIIIMMALIMRGIYVLFIAPKFFPDTVNLPFFHTYRLLKYILYNLDVVVIITTGVRLFNYWYYQTLLNNELVQEKLTTELSYLKGQLHPHFLFNTLNNIYALCLDKSDLAPGVVLKLSDLLSFMLYDAKKDTILFSKEIENLRSYLELEKIRYGNRIDIVFNLSGNPADKVIAPLITLPFIENAFKHSFSEDLNDIWINIDISIHQDSFLMKVKNSVSANISNATAANGIGLENIKRRLSLLYPHSHTLQLLPNKNYYEIILNIQSI